MDCNVRLYYKYLAFSTLTYTLLSNCDAPSERRHYIRELMNYIPIDSYGPCLHTKDFPSDIPGRYNSRDKAYLAEFIKGYKVQSDVIYFYVCKP